MVKGKGGARCVEGGRGEGEGEVCGRCIEGVCKVAEGGGDQEDQSRAEGRERRRQMKVYRAYKA